MKAKLLSLMFFSTDKTRKEESVLMEMIPTSHEDTAQHPFDDTTKTQVN